MLDQGQFFSYLGGNYSSNIQYILVIHREKINTDKIFFIYLLLKPKCHNKFNLFYFLTKFNDTSLADFTRHKTAKVKHEHFLLI